MSRIPASELRAMRERCEAATIPPWERSGDYIHQTKHITRDVWTIPRVEEDLDFIARAREDLPALLDAYEAALELMEMAIAPTTSCSIFESIRAYLSPSGQQGEGDKQ